MAKESKGEELSSSHSCLPIDENTKVKRKEERMRKVSFYVLPSLAGEAGRVPGWID